MYLWILVLMILPCAGQAYIMWHSWNMLPAVPALRWCAISLEFIAFALFFLAMSGRINKMPLPLARSIYTIGTSWLIIMLYLFMAFLLLDIGRLIHLVPRSFLHNNLYSSLGLFAVMLIIFIYGNIHYYNKVKVELTYKTEKKLAGPVKMILISDMHLGYHNTRADLRKWIKLINDEGADVLLIAGDIVDGSMRPVDEENMYEEFKALTMPVYACYGNHDYLTGIDADRDFCMKAGIKVLKDSIENIGDITIVGRDDRTNRHRKSLSDIMNGIDKSKFIVELDHQPYHLEEAQQCNVDLELAGHTHYGQVWPLSWITDAVYECAYGKSQRGNTNYYISSGLGIWGGKFRIGTQSEYVVINIEN